MASVRSLAANCLDKTPTLSIRRDLLGVYGTDNPLNRSLRARLGLIQSTPFVPVALVTISGATPSVQRDLDNANTVLQDECGMWLYPVGSRVENEPALLALNQPSCPLGTLGAPTTEEDDLYDLGRDMGADIVAYYVQSISGGWAGCSAHPAGRRGFTVAAGASPWTFVHELVHMMGFNPHVGDSDNVMSTPTANITNPPPDMTNAQCNNVTGDGATEDC